MVFFKLVLSVWEQASEVPWDKFHDQEKFLKALRLRRNYNVIELGGEYIAFHLAKLGQDIDFSSYKSPVMVRFDIFNVFDRNNLTRGSDLGFVDLPIAPRTKQVSNFIFFLQSWKWVLRILLHIFTF